MCISKLLKTVPLLGLLTLAACSGGGDDGPGVGPSTPITTTNYTADFSPTHVIDAAAAPATVSATASLSTARGDDITASGTVTVSGTTATTVTINVGYAGENGPIAVTLNDAGGGDWVIPSGTALDITELRILDSTGYYVRIQSPDGELRGQILPPGWAVGTIDLDAASVVTGSTSAGTAKAGFALNPAIGTYYARVTVSGISDVTSAGIRDAIAGSVGDLVAPLEESMTTAGVWGSRDINDANANDILTTTGVELLGNGRLYISIESASSPDGALRGQLIDDTINVFHTEMTASQVVTAGPPVASTAQGRATTTWIEALSRLGIAINTDIPNAFGAGVYQGMPGENGTLLFTLTQNAVLTGNWYLPPTDLSAEQASALESGGLYVSIATPAYPSGELRAQVALPPPEATVVLIGPAGGEVNTEDGITLSVPAGALAETRPISVRRLEGTRALPAPFADPVVPLHAAVEFGPEGVEFALPVTLSIDLEKAAPAGTSQPILVYDPAGDTWQETEFIATVNNDGTSATVDLTHFSDYAVTLSEKDSAGYFGPVDLLTENRNEIFERIRNRFNTAFLQNADPRPYDPGTVPSNDPFNPGVNLFNCYFPAAATFILDTGDSSTEQQPALVETLGNPEGSTFYMAFSRFYEESYLTVVDDEEVTVDLSALYQVFVYYFAKSPDIETEVAPGAVWVADESDVSVRVRCGEFAFRDQDVMLGLSNAAIGSASPNEGTSNDDGLFESVFTASPMFGGQGRLEASTDWSEPVSGVALTISNSTNVDVYSLTGTWSGGGTETIQGCEDDEENGRFEGEATFPINQEGMSISGGGFWTSFNGNVTPRSDGTFTVSGSYEESGEVTSTGTFTGDGSAASGTISLAWRGADSEGTCQYEGTGTATLQ